MRSVVIINPLPMHSDMLCGSLYMPYGPLYLAESLLHHGYHPVIVNDTYKATVERIAALSEKPLCVGISTMSGRQLANAVAIAKELKAFFPGLPLVWGGVHCTALPEQTLQSDLVDVLVWGEGEEVFPLVVSAIEDDDIESLLGIPGIGIRDNDIGVLGCNSGYSDISSRVFDIPYHLLDMPRYSRELLIGPQREYPIWTSRGCPFRCRFCSNGSKVWPNTKMRFHTIEHIAKDVHTLHSQYGADCITFADEGFLQDQDRFLSILQAIKEDGVDVKYRFSARVDLLLRLRDSTWEALKDYGVIGISTAPESGSERILKYMGKGITLDQIYKVDELLTKHKFFKAFNVLICTPEETIDDLKDTMRLLLNLAKTSTCCPYPLGTLHKYIPLPGTEMFEDAIRRGLQPPGRLEDWVGYDLEDAVGRRSTVRPWITDADGIFIGKAIAAMESLNQRFTGRGVDPASIEAGCDDIRTLLQS